MAHKRQLEKTKYRQWVKAGLGLTYLREGISAFCDDIAKQQQKDILDNIKHTKNLSAIACGQCDWTSLSPDHSKGGNKHCTLGQRNCNCCNPSGKVTCPNKVCGAIFDAIVKCHGFTPPAPYWKNTETKHWCTDPWSIAKCFINASGYDKKATAADIDCIGLLHLIRNNLYFHDHIQCTIAQNDVFSKVIVDRHELFHSSTMELEETEANAYIADMIAVLQDGKELNNRQDAKDAVKKLEELKNNDFVITTENEAKLLRDVAEEIRDLLERFENKTEDLATKEECDRLKTQLSELESAISELKREMKRLKANDSSQQEPIDYEQSKLALQKRLMVFYREKDMLRMSALPQQQEGNLCDFKDVYVRPQMTTESKDQLNDTPKVADVESMSDIFTKDGKPIKNVYVLGKAGSGKSSFCKSLVHYWCLAHSEEGQTIEDKFSGVKEMKKFNFLFFLPLRHYTDKTKIKEMLEEKYDHPVLKKVLECESGTCLVVLDGLDEWTSTASKCPPEHCSLKDYTVLTTSRPWKIATLGISDNEIRQKVVLKGFHDKSSVKDLIEKTVPILNKMFRKDRNSSKCEKALETKSVASLKHTAIMLQQLICLWYDDKLRSETSRCALCTEMLDLFFDWNKKKHPDDPLFKEMMKKSEFLQNVQLPHFLIETEVCKSYSYIIGDVSRLAYETLFNNTKETSLSFDSSTFERLKISNEVKTCCLQLGILSEDKCQSLSASRSRRSIIAFVHKTFQEYLAAVYIAIKFSANVVSSAEQGNVSFSDKCAEFIQSIFSKCTSLDEILEQENVFIMLCGLELSISTSISKYIYDIVSRDGRVLKYRQGVDDGRNLLLRSIYDKHSHANLISNIQGCILNCIEEVQACQTHIQSNFYLGDILVMSEIPCNKLCTSAKKEFISPGRVISLRIDVCKKEMFIKRVWNYLRKCQKLEVMCIGYSLHSKIDAEDIESICDIIECNTTTLKSLSVVCYSIHAKPIFKTIVSRLPDMSHLFTLQLHGSLVRHEDVTSLCIFLSGSSHLKHLSISMRCCADSIVYFMCSDRIHAVDLSKHQQLQCLVYRKPFTVTRIHTSNLEIFKCSSLNRTNFENVFDHLSTANKLTELDLGYDITGSRRNPSYHTLTDKMISVLPSLHQLRELTLQNFTLTDNIMKCPSEMNSMKIIDLNEVRMSLTTWRQFVDSVLLMPLHVRVKAHFMCITQDGEECYPNINWVKGGGEEAAAWQYVREQGVLFKVEFEYENSINFSIKE